MSGVDGEGSAGDSAIALYLDPHAIGAGAREEDLEGDPRPRRARDLDDRMTVHRSLQIAADDQQVRGRAEKWLEVLDWLPCRGIGHLERHELLPAGNGI